MSNIKKTKKGLIEKSTGRKINSPMDAVVSPLYQNIVITMSDGSSHVFTGKAFAYEGDNHTIKNIQFTIPKKLPGGYAFEVMD